MLSRVFTLQRALTSSLFRHYVYSDLLGDFSFSPGDTRFECGNLECDTIQSGIDTTGGLVDTVIEASGATSSIDMGINVVQPGGKYVQTGLGKPKIEFPIVALSQKELTVRGCFRYGAGDYELAVRFLEKGLIDVKPLISSITPFEKATEAWEKTALLVASWVVMWWDMV